jgi:hypothetical protein
MAGSPVRWSIGATCALLGLALSAPLATADGPKVRSKAAADQEKPASIDLYGPGDLSTLPAWEQTSFFGLRARGKFFVFVIDCSGSMGDGRLMRAKAELRRTITQMRFPQKFLVIFYNDETQVMPGGVPRGADYSGVAALDAWLSRIDADGGTQPRGAMRLALGLQPDAVFLLSDGEFPRGTVEEIMARNQKPTPVHCIDLGNGKGTEDLRRIAEHSGGRYVGR